MGERVVEDPKEAVKPETRTVTAGPSASRTRALSTKTADPAKATKPKATSGAEIVGVARSVVVMGMLGLVVAVVD